MNLPPRWQRNRLVASRDQLMETAGRLPCASDSLVRACALPARDWAVAVSTSHSCSRLGAPRRPGVVDDSLGLVDSPGFVDIVRGLACTDLRPTAHRRGCWLKSPSHVLLPFLGNSQNATTAF